MKEELIVQFFNRLGYGTILDTITNSISYIPFLIGLWLVLGIIALFLDKKNGKVVFVSAIIAIALHFLISEGVFKYLVADYVMRVRPYIEHPGLIVGMGYDMFKDSSFPSSHMASSLAVLTVFTYFYRKVWPVVLVFVLFMAFSRLHMGMHYPSDVLAGIVLGITYGFLGIFIAKKIFKRKKLK